jgi:hypothetical protein
VSGEQVKRVLEEIAGLLGIRFGTLEVRIQDGALVQVFATRGLKPAELEAELAEQ